MEREEVLKRYRIDKLEDTALISGEDFYFTYTTMDSVLKNNNGYFSSLQSVYDSGSVEHEYLEKWLCEIAEMVLGYK